MTLHLGESSHTVVELAPEFLCLRLPISTPPDEGEVILCIDREERRVQVRFQPGQTGLKLLTR